MAAERDIETTDGAERESAAATAPVPAPSTDGSSAQAQAPAGVSAPEGEGGESAISVAEHPKAARLVRRSREAAGLAGFLVGGWMSLSTHAFADALLRAVLAGAICQLVVWAAAVTLCRYLVAAELRSREDALLQAALAKRRAGAGASAPGIGAPAGNA